MTRRRPRSSVAACAAACLAVTVGMPVAGRDAVVVEGDVEVVEEEGVDAPAEMPDSGPANVELQVQIQGAEVAPQVAAPAGGGGGFLGLGLRAMFNAIAPIPIPQPVPPQPLNVPIPVDEAEDGEMPNDPRAQQQWQQRKQIRQQAKNLEQLFQPALRTELEMIRQACPDLSPAARREIVAAGRTAVSKTALEFATRQMLGGQPRRAFDARRSIQAPMARALEPHVAADTLETYGKEQAARLARREKAARVAIVSKLDRQLDLTAAQRRAIEGDLDARWDDAWLRELDDTGMVINAYRPAPDYANECIEPHLDADQRAEWDRWRKAAGMSVVGMHIGWNFDGQGLQQEDPWWTPDGTP